MLPEIATRTLSLILATAPLAAVAECPVRADLETGIALRDSDGYRYVMTDLGNGVVQQDGQSPDGYAFRNLLGQGSHILQLADQENGALLPDSITNYAYPMRPDEMPVPAPNTRWQVGYMITSFGDTYQEFQNQSWGPLRRLQIGVCDYEMIVGTIIYKSEAGTIREEIHFLPELGIGILAAYDDGDGYNEVFTYLSIETAR